ncbi:YD repeat-containing protein [Dysgonomonas hofstadii]|uniref:YD repeat-containing protein n=1 Tax=Dysgonomonas hofstadii TaxID=637886 RepID=A0A840D1X3_9BACT|nr:RHS repeat domain-containing protein [Dysgonomonas hofstadii]MBB4038343.1 YD repeat-containing protein [Dysgonomonas hofstadii]
MRKYILLFILLVFAMNIIYSQEQISLTAPQIVPVTPTAATMEKYQSYPIDHSTGVPNITIPLYEIVAEDIVLPVTLTYHSSGLKPKERSGVAGTGWSLNIEPSVMRQVNGAPDDSEYGWFYRRNPNSYSSAGQYYQNVVLGSHDLQPDKFTYRLANGGGSGYFLSNIHFQTLPRNNDKVTFGNKITIKASDGKTYLFGTYEKTGDIITRWLCNSISSPRNPSKALINFQYISEAHPNPNTYFHLNHKVIITSLNGDIPILTEQTQSGNKYYKVAPYNMIYPFQPYNPNALLVQEHNAGIQGAYPISLRYESKTVYGELLNEVRFQNNTLSVSYNGIAGSTVVDKIEIKDTDNKLIRRIQFFTSLYNKNTTLTKLDSIRISVPGSESRTYKFTYQAINQVPSIYTTAVDHWGFNNGSESLTNTSTVPSFSCGNRVFYVFEFEENEVIINYSGANREPNHSYAKVGVLTNIIDPQGVETQFSYEGNYGAFRNNTPTGKKEYLHSVGGIRIAKVESKDTKTGKKITKKYRYGLVHPYYLDLEPVWGGGAIKHIVTERDYCTENVDAYAGSKYDSATKGTTTFNSMPVSNISLGGSAVMYSIVEETVVGAGYETQVSKYYYNVNIHNFEDALQWDENDLTNSIQTFLRQQPRKDASKPLIKALPNNPSEPSDDFINYPGGTNQLYGSMIRKEHYRGEKLISRTDFKYSTGLAGDANREIYFPYLVTDWTEEDRKAQTRYYLDIRYYNRHDKEILSDYRYANGRSDVITTEKEYAYNFNVVDPLSSMKPREIKTTNSDNTLIVDSLDYLSGFPSTVSRHKHNENNSWKESRILFKSGTNFPEKVQSRTNQMAEFRDEVIYTAYDNNNNIAEITGKDDMPISFIWGYQNQFPIAKIENASIQQILTTLGIVNATLSSWASSIKPPNQAWAMISSIRNLLPNALVTTYEYNPLQGVTSITDPNNITTKFEYDNYGRLTEGYYLDMKSQSDIRKVMLQKYVYNFGN